MTRLALFGFFALSLSASAQVIDNAAIRKILAQRIDEQRQSVGIAVGVIDANGRRVVTHGNLAKGGAAVDADTLFEIGSITKAFTSLLLAEMAAKGEVALEDPVAKYLPSEVKVPTRGDKVIRLIDLAQHRSGLPRLPGNLKPKDNANPYADYTPELLYAFLNQHQLTRDIGAQADYSNLGAGLLGHALARKAGVSYEKLIAARLTGPLGMKSTMITVPATEKSRFASGHDVELKPVSYWDMDALAGAGALRSNANDMLKLLAALLDYEKTPLVPAIAATFSNRTAGLAPNMDMGLGWMIVRKNGKEIVWHNGGTGGFRSFLGFDLKKRQGVVLLSNTSTQAGVDDIGLHLLDPESPLIPPPLRRQEMTLDPKVLDRYVGRYQVVPGFVLNVTREGQRMFVQATNQPRFEIFAESDRKFFLKVVEAQLSFEVAGDGPSPSATLHQNGRNMPAQRVE